MFLKWETFDGFFEILNPTKAMVWNYRRKLRKFLIKITFLLLFSKTSSMSTILFFSLKISHHSSSYLQIGFWPFFVSVSFPKNIITTNSCMSLICNKKNLIHCRLITCIASLFPSTIDIIICIVPSIVVYATSRMVLNALSIAANGFHLHTNTWLIDDDDED